MDREQVRRDAEIELSGQWRKSATAAATSLAHDVLALLAELEQAERERDEALNDGDTARQLAHRCEEALTDAEAQLAKVPALKERAAKTPLNVDISDYSDEFCAGFLAGQENALAAVEQEQG